MAPKRKAATTTAPPEAPPKRPRGRPPKRKPSSGPSRASTTDSSLLVLGDPSASGNESSGLSEVPDDVLDAMEGLLGLSKGSGGEEELDEDEDEDEKEKEKEVVELGSSSEDEAVSKKKKATNGKKAVRARNKKKAEVPQADESEADEDEYEEDDEAELVTYLVPDGASVVEIELPLSMPKDDFFRRIADEIDVRRRDLHIGHKFSTALVKAKAIRLKEQDNSTSYESMVHAAQKELKKRRKTRKEYTKEFTIEIVDLREKPKKDSAVDKKKKKQQRGKARNKKSQTASTSSDDDDDADDGAGKKTKAKHLIELQAQRFCQTHQRYCISTPDGREHLELSIGNMSLWSVHLAEQKHTSYLDPPDEVKTKIVGMNPENGPPRLNSRARPNALIPPAYPPPGFPPYYPPPNGPYPYYGYAPPPPPAPVVQPLPAANITRTQSTDSEEFILYPLIEKWLPGLDADPIRGGDEYNFGQFAASFISNGYKQIDSLLGESQEQLRELCPGMNKGTAKLLEKYVAKDCQLQRDYWKNHNKDVPV
ncbi:hypothetical protein C8F01DRAFT_1083144 [Mycena amicta]|nr:hypothetical protein C8F01DRAFT_1083144 [Mycena amicta]